MTHHVPAAHQGEDRLALLAEHARRSADDAVAPVDPATVAGLVEVAIVAREVLAVARDSGAPPAVEAILDRLEDRLARLDQDG